MRMSISLPARDVALLDEYVHTHGLKSRSAAVKRAVDLLRAVDLADAYAAAWAEWDDGSDKGEWTRATKDGLTATPWAAGVGGPLPSCRAGGTPPRRVPEAAAVMRGV